MVGPDYKRPDAAVPNAYANPTNGWKVAEPEGQVTKGNWWEVFGDPELNQLEEQSAVANQELNAATQRFFEARAQMDVSRAGLFPSVGISGEYSHQRASVNEPLTTGQPLGHTAAYNDYTIPLDFSYEADLWGRVRRLVESSRAQMQASADDVESVKLVIQAEVAEDYFSLRAFDSEQAVLRSSVTVFSKSLDLTINRRQGGVANDLEVAQARTVFDTTEAQVPEVALKRQQFEHALAVLTGQSPSTFHILEKTIGGEPPRVASGIPSDLLERRPDISGAERRMASANAQIGVAKAAFFPTVTLNGLVGLESLSAATLFNASSRFWSAGPSVSLPIFEGGRLRAGLRLSQATYEETVANYRQTVLTAFSEVEDNLAAQELLANEYASESEALVAARQQLDVANNRYRDGLITYLEVATAESMELNIEFAALQLRDRQYVAAVSLIKALGGGWQDGAANLQLTKTNSKE
jgi:multidrug efflux system outer membrane protein